MACAAMWVDGWLSISRAQSTLKLSLSSWIWALSSWWIKARDPRVTLLEIIGQAQLRRYLDTLLYSWPPYQETGYRHLHLSFLQIMHTYFP